MITCLFVKSKIMMISIKNLIQKICNDLKVNDSNAWEMARSVNKYQYEQILIH